MVDTIYITPVSLAQVLVDAFDTGNIEKTRHYIAM